MKKTATIIVFEEDHYNSMFKVLFADALEAPDVYSIIEKSYPEGKLYGLLPSRKLKKLTFGLSNSVYLRYYKLPRIVKELCRSYDRVNILFHNASLRKPRYPQVVFDYIKKYPVAVTLLYLDKHDHEHVCSYANMLFENNIFDRVLTFDPDDAKKYDIELCTTPYSKIALGKSKEINNVYFCGSNAGRIYMLYKIWESARKHNISVEYDLLGCHDCMPFFENDPNIHFNQYFLEYSQLLKEMQKSRCILDFTQTGQSGFTLRPYEAVVYNKKLLTNNKRIFEFPFYDARYMRYFEKIEDIDWEWIKEQIDVDYSYNGEFSPLLLLKRLGGE